MIRYNIYLEEDQIWFLKQLSGTVSEHIRLAIDNYIKDWHITTSTSPSTLTSKSSSKGGKLNA